MGRGKDFRERRPRGFQDDPFAANDMMPPRPPQRSDDRGGWGQESGGEDGPALDATVKWFNPEKGFGFAALADGSGDVFLHVARLQEAGHEQVAPGTTLNVSVAATQKGRQVTRVHSVDDSTAEAEPPRRAGGFGGGGAGRPSRFAPSTEDAEDMSGAVKWFNPTKGMGFIEAADGGRDIFVHISVLEAAGLASLAEGQRVSMRVVETQKGRKAVSIAVE